MRLAFGSITDAAFEAGMLDLALLAMARMRVTNLGIHLSMSFGERYRQLTGERAPNDGFWGPRVFDSAFGPTRHYLDSAVAARDGRRSCGFLRRPECRPAMPLPHAVRSGTSGC